MKRHSLTLFMTSLLACGAVSASTVTLDGSKLTIDEAWAVATGEAKVAIASEAITRLNDSHRLVMAAAKKGSPVYGLTVGVGLNKDRSLFDASGALSKEVLDASRAFNYNALRSHSAGVGPMMPENLARLSMVIRLNTLLTGQSGAQTRVAELYRDFLNNGITPQIPARGTVGEADILLASHVGAVMIGEWKASVNGKVMDGAAALKAKKIKPLVPEGKDALAILSNNSVAMAYVVDAARSSRQVLRITPLVYGLSLEALNGNIAPILPQSLEIRPFPSLLEAGETLRTTLTGSYLWEKDASRALQDPLSYRTTVYTFAEAKRAQKDLEDVINVQINSSDDNPGTILNAPKDYADTSSQVASYFVKGDQVEGAIIPTANFEPLPVALASQRMSLALAHLSHNAVQRTIHLSDDHFTGLPRFLAAPGNVGHAFGAIQKAFMGLQVENMALAQPVSLYGMPVAGDIEDTFTSVMFTGQRLKGIAENTRTIYSLELLHATQAIDLRRADHPNLTLSKETEKLFKAYRQKVPFVQNDRIFTTDIENGTKLLENL